MKLELVRALESDQPKLENLLELYVHDFSELLGLTPGEDGRFSYPKLPLYWREDGRAPFLVRADERLVGFALVSRGSQVSGDPDVWDVAEFFVVRGVRRRGVGLAAAEALFATRAGTWEVRVLDLNASARRFWQHALERLTQGSYSVEPWTRDDGTAWHVFRFTSGNVARG
jgi:predicted acetyltransferase